MKLYNIWIGFNISEDRDEIRLMNYTVIIELSKIDDEGLHYTVLCILVYVLSVL